MYHKNNEIISAYSIGINRQVIQVLFYNYTVSSLVFFGSFDISLYRQYTCTSMIDVSIQSGQSMTAQEVTTSPMNY